MGLVRAARLVLPVIVAPVWSRIKEKSAVRVPLASGDVAAVLLATTVLTSETVPLALKWPTPPVPTPAPLTVLPTMVLFWISAVPVRVPRYTPLTLPGAPPPPAFAEVLPAMVLL